MRDRDLADSPLASCAAEPPRDSLGDTLLEPFAQYDGPLPATRAAFRQLATELLGQGLEDAARGQLATIDEAQMVQHSRLIIVRLLQLMSRDQDRHYALRAVCYLRLLKIEGRSFDAIGREFGLTRAGVQAVYRKLQRRHPELRARGDKSDAAREACRQRRIGMKKPAEKWAAAHLWKQPLSLPSKN